MTGGDRYKVFQIYTHICVDLFFRRGKLLKGIRKRRKLNWIEGNLLLAVQAVTLKGYTIRRAATLYGVPKSTISDRFVTFPTLQPFNPFLWPFVKFCSLLQNFVAFCKILLNFAKL